MDNVLYDNEWIYWVNEARKLALNSFLAGVEKRAYKMALFSVSDRDEALDLVQEAMIRLVKKYSERPEDQWRPLFYRILNNQINDFHRRGKVRKFVRGLFGGGDEELQVQIADERDAGPAAQLGKNQAMSDLQEALQTLPARQQQAFLLRTWEGLSVRETAQTMGCSEGSVKTHTSRAMQRLQEHLGEHWQ